MRTTVGILPFNSERMLPGVLESLPAGLQGVDDWRLVIVDNGSTDATVHIAAQLAPQATIVELGDNLGFAAGVNAVAAADPDSDAILILSPTARLGEGSVAAMLAVLDQPGVGVVVPRLFSQDGEPRLSLRRRPTVLRAFGEAVLGGGLAKRHPALSEMIPLEYDGSTRADWATGGVTMMSRECLTKAGPWDESFFLYSEEVEFELRAADHGYRLAFAPDARAVHIGGDSRARPELFALLCANRVRLHGMRHGPAAATAFLAAMALGEAMRSVKPDGRRHRAALAKLLREGPRLVRGRPATHP